MPARDRAQCQNEHRQDGASREGVAEERQRTVSGISRRLGCLSGRTFAAADFSQFPLEAQWIKRAQWQ